MATSTSDPYVDAGDGAPLEHGGMLWKPRPGATLLLIGKIVATSLTIGIGGSGGVFAPSLFIGAMGGTAFGIALHAWLPGLTASPGVYGLIGMGAAFAGAARAPMTAVVILFELTGQYTIILPMLTAIVIATATSKALLGQDTIYTLKLRRRGVHIDRSPESRRLGALTVNEVMEPLPESLAAKTDLGDAAHALAVSGHGILPVVGDDGRYRGCVTARAVAETLAADEKATTAIADLAELPPLLTPDSSLADALTALTNASGTGLPVLSADRELIGWLTHQAVLNSLHQVPAGAT
ncbi:MAG TPA: chloride channel protein [Amycolatopsis sp.]|nr:chloride channel protein [Amycolatopsis sp.]